MKLHMNEKSMNEKNEVKRAIFGDYKHKIKTFAIFTAENPMGMALEPQENNKRTAELKQYLNRMHIQYVPIDGKFDTGSSPITKNYGDGKYGKYQDTGKYKFTTTSRDEHSFICINIKLSEAKYLCQKFEQLSFFFGEQLWDETNDTDTDDDSKTVNTFNTDDTKTVDKTLNWDKKAPKRNFNTSGSVLSYWETKEAGGEYKCIEKSRTIVDAKSFDNFFSKHASFKYSIAMTIFEDYYPEINDIISEWCLDEALFNESLTSFAVSRRRWQAYNE